MAFGAGRGGERTGWQSQSPKPGASLYLYPGFTGSIIGPLLALYGIYLSIVGIREMHGTTTGKAALVVLIPFAVVLVVLLAVGAILLFQR